MKKSDVVNNLKECVSLLEDVQRHYDLYSKDVDDELSEALSHLNEALDLLKVRK